MDRSSRIVTFIIPLMMFLSNACSVIKDGDAIIAGSLIFGDCSLESDAENINSDVLEGFEPFHNFAVNTCSECHGADQFPKFALEDNMELSYVAGYSKVNFLNLSASPIQYKASDPSHCNLCGPHLSAEVLGHLQVWKDAELAAGGGVISCGSSVGPAAPPIKTIEKALPDTIGVPTTMFWFLDSELVDSTSSYGGAIFSIDVEYLAAGGYNFENPRLSTGTEDLHIAEILFVMNQDPNSHANSYLLVDTVVPANEAPGPILSPISMQIIHDDPVGNVLHIEFGTLEIDQ